MSPLTENTGHGHVRPRPDGIKMRCGGPKICTVCALELANLGNDIISDKDALSLALGVREDVLVGKETHPINVETLCCWIIKRLEK